jgi:hypothetical protein
MAWAERSTFRLDEYLIVEMVVEEAWQMVGTVVEERSKQREARMSSIDNSYHTER